MIQKKMLKFNRYLKTILYYYKSFKIKNEINDFIRYIILYNFYMKKIIRFTKPRSASL